MGVVENWLESRKAARRLREFERIEKHLRLARRGLRKIRTDVALKSNLHMVQDTSRLLIDLQIYKRDIGVLQDEHLRREVARVRSGFRASTVGFPSH